METAGTARSTRTSGAESAAMRTTALASLVVEIERASHQPPETYTFGSEGGRATGATLALLFGLLLALLGVLPIGHAGFWSGGDGLGWLVTWIGWGGALMLMARHIANAPYEIRVPHCGLVSFVSVTGVSDVHTADILRIVRYEWPRDGGLAHFRVVHRHGSIQVQTGRAEIVERLAALSPAAQVSSEEYNPD